MGAMIAGIRLAVGAVGGLAMVRGWADRGCGRKGGE